MARTYKVWISKDVVDAGGYRSGSQADEVQTVYNVNYDVLVEDDAGGFDGSQVDVFEILSLITPGQTTTGIALPVVNATAFYNPNSGLLFPYLICRSKQGSRDPDQKNLWHVQTTWDTGSNASTTEGDNAGQTPPAAITDLTPRIEVRFGDQDIQLYLDQDNKPCFTPTGNEYPEPFFERTGTQIITIHQYVASITFDEMQNRKWRLNDATYSGKPKHSWIIKNVEATEVTVQLAGGPFLAALVSHTIEYTYLDQLWYDRRYLVDTHYLEGGIKKEFTDGELKQPTVGFVEADGSKRTLPDPTFEDFRLQRDIDFSSFLPTIP